MDGSPADRQSELTRARGELEAELQRLHREEEYLDRQIRRAEEQLRYYELLLADLSKSAGRAGPLQQFLRRVD